MKPVGFPMGGRDQVQKNSVKPRVLEGFGHDNLSKPQLVPPPVAVEGHQFIVSPNLLSGGCLHVRVAGAWGQGGERVRGALGEVVGGASATVDPEDVPTMKWQLARLARDAALREQLRAAGLARARQFDWQTTAAMTLEVYERAVAEGQEQPAAAAVRRPAKAF